MNPWILALSHFIHIIGTIIWIGGILMILFVVLPGTKEALESPSMVGKMMKGIAERFTPLANISIILLIISGIVIFYNNKNYTWLFDPENRWNMIIALKFLIVAIMIAIHFYRGWILAPKIERTSLKSDEILVTRLKKLSLDLVKVNFVFGITVLLLTAFSISV